MKFRKCLALATAFALVAGPVAAADLSYPVKAPPPIVPVFTWSGCYLGANAGWEKGSKKHVPISGSENLDESIDLGNVPPSLDIDRDGFIGGGQIGCNWQTDRLVLGVEADLMGLDSKGSDSYVGFPAVQFPDPEVLTHGRSELDWLGTVRLRLGAAFDRLLVYGTGGLAYGHVEARGSIVPNFDSPDAPAYYGSDSDTDFGWTVGGGLEYAFDDHWTIGAEYLYYDLGSHDVTLYSDLAGYDPAKMKFETAGSIVRARLNYKF
jgi:outer membrane immunogenic protein